MGKQFRGQNLPGHNQSANWELGVSPSPEPEVIPDVNDYGWKRAKKSRATVEPCFIS